MSNVVVLHRCVCGSAGAPIKLDYDDQTVAAFMACAECVARTNVTLAKVKPVFESMISAGVERKVANDTMTFLLDGMDRSDG